MQPKQTVSSFKTNVRKVIIVVIILAGLLTGTALWLNGGIRPILDNILPTPNPTSKKLVAKRENAESEILKEFSLIEKDMGYDSGVASSYNSCYEGQNNYKVHEGYSNKCDIRITKYYGSSSNFRQQMMKLHQTFISSNWESREKDSLPYYMTDYYDIGRKISDLPRVYGGYTKEQKTIAISYAEKGAQNIRDLENAQGLSMRGYPFYEDKKFQDIQTLFDELSKTNNFVVSISITDNYYKN